MIVFAKLVRHAAVPKNTGGIKGGQWFNYLILKLSPLFSLLLRTPIYKGWRKSQPR